MCQPLPGPRCAGHAKTAVDAARARRDAAEQAVESAVAALEAARATGATIADTIEEHNAIGLARKELDAARVAHSEALREYETTPKGQEDLAEAARALRAAGDEQAAADAEKRLEVARATREQHVKDLAAARAINARLAAANPGEVAAMDQADAAVRDAEQALEQARQVAAEAAARIATLRPEYDAAQQVYAAARAAIPATEQATLAAASNVAVEARRLYRDAGVPERNIGYYTSDMIDNAREKPAGGRRHTSTLGPVAKTMTVKVKPASHPDHAATAAAREAAKTDPRFKAANQALGQAVATRREALQALKEIHTTQVDQVAEAYTQANRDSMNAKHAITDSKHRLETAQSTANVLKARVGAGMGVEGQTKPLSRVGDEIQRNPDGTTNAYVYRAPSPGFPHGRMAAVVDVTTVHGMAAANALVLEDGSKVSAGTHHFRNTRGPQTNSSDTVVHLTAAADGAHPLRSENVANAGFATFIDSTD